MVLVCTQGVQAQQVGTCRLGSATADLDAGDVRAALYNNGGFFWRGSGNTYTVPKDGQANSIFAAGLWLAGTAPDGTHRFAGTAYGPWEYWPGPLDNSGNPPDDCDDYDRMYSVRTADIRAYERDGLLSSDLRDWPHHLGAPVVDGDGIAGNYSLADGDRPAVYGEQSVWWVMNDVGNAKEYSQTRPIGLEVQVQAFSASCLPLGGTRVSQFDRVVSQTTYYRFTIIHKGQAALDDFYMGWWTDADLGNAADDFVATDTTLRMGYYYNGLDFDAGTDGYGDQPPAIGFILTEGMDTSFDGRDNNNDGRVDESDERLPFTNTLYYNSDSSPLGNPDSRTIDNYNYMRSIWRDGQPVTHGGTGYGGTEPTRFMFPGDPVTGSYWSEVNTGGSGFGNTPADRRFLMSSGPLNLTPGDTTTFTLAIVWGQGEDRFGSILALRGAAAIAASVTENLMTSNSFVCNALPEPEGLAPTALGYYLLRQNYPEPFSQQTTIRYEVINTVPVQLNVYDVLGRRVRTLVDGMQDAGVYDVVFEADDLPTGMYFYRLEAAGYVSITRRMT
ncbi:MAG: T9SS type A sorting domain-containing protein, partial [Bacteroidota bacterium]